MCNINNMYTISNVSPLLRVADNHVFTSKTTAKQVRSNTHSQVAVLLSLGLDPDRVILYKHSAVLQHTALAWLLSTSATSGYSFIMTFIITEPIYSLMAPSTYFLISSFLYSSLLISI